MGSRVGRRDNQSKLLRKNWGGGKEMKQSASAFFASSSFSSTSHIVHSYFECSAMLHLESQMPLSLGQHSFGAAPG